MDNTKKSLIILGLLAIGLVILSNFTSKTGLFGLNCKTVEEAYIENVPYNDKLCLNIPVVNTTCENKEITYSRSFSCSYPNNVQTAVDCIVNNLDTITGNFTVSLGVVNDTNETQTAIIDPQSSYIFRSVFDASVQCYCNVISVPQKSVCTDKITTTQQCYDVAKIREETKYRNVTKCD